jgi:DNA-binding NarL/FixJ family response regulator
MNIRVVIADDHPIVRSGISAELARSMDIEVIGEALTGDEALRLACDLQPDVLLLDVNMPGLRADKVVREIKRVNSHCKVLILTAFGDTTTVIGMMRAGADGYMLKDEEPELIPDAVRALKADIPWYSPAISPVVTSVIQNANWSSASGLLTEREFSILQYLTEGRPNKEIALELGIKERTVEFHLGNMMAKVGVRSRLELALWAKEHPHLINQAS